MTSITQQGALNTTALVVPDLYIQIVAPTPAINGVPTNVAGVVGTASWGPVGAPVIVGSLQDQLTAFGPIQNRKYDLGTPVFTAMMQGASNFRCVRVTDGTDAAATIVILTSCITLTALYTGTLGNQIQASFSAGSKAGTSRVTIGIPGYASELFDNIGGSGNAFWVNVAAAINNGNSIQRGPSLLVTASAGAGTTAVATAISGSPYTLASGSDGVGTITSSVLVGQDTLPRKGMYALRGQGCSVAMLSDADDSTQWTTQGAFGLSEAIYMVLVSPSGDTIANITGPSGTKATAGLDTYAAKLMFGDWLWWNDPVNGVRLVSPQGFALGKLSALSPEQSSLNKPLFGVIGSQKIGAPGTAQAQRYSPADLQTLFQAGVDVITNPGAGGLNIWTVRCGHNSSSNAAVNGDNYTRMTNYIATTLAAGMGQFEGLVINNNLLRDIRSTELGFLANLLGQNILALNADGSVPYKVVCDITNNPQARTSLGYVQSDAAITYQGINEKFLVNIQGGATVVTMQSTGTTVTPVQS